MADTSTLILKGNEDAPPMAFSTSLAHIIVIGSSVFSIFWGLVNALMVKNIDMTQDHGGFIQNALDKKGADEDNDDDDDKPKDAAGIHARLNDLGEKITNGAISFLAEEYLYLSLFCTAFAVLLGVTVDWQEMSAEQGATNFPYTATAFLIGAATSILSGYIGMRIAVYTNSRTTYLCCDSTDAGFKAAFKGGQVLGFVLVGLALLILDLIVIVFKICWFDEQYDLLVVNPKVALTEDQTKEVTRDLIRKLFELVAGYGLGGSTVALFGRVGGGIYTKAADVGADLVGKVLKDLREDDPSNPGTIADNVGDNVGDIAGMGADLFGSLAEATCAALVVSSTSYDLIMHTDAIHFPLMITAVGILASFLSVLLAYVKPVTIENVQTVLKMQLVYSTIFMSFTLVPVVYLLPDKFELLQAGGATLTVTQW